MKLKTGFSLQTVAGQHVVLPDVGTVDMDMMITLNDTGRFLWERLEEETDEQRLTAALLEEYDVAPEVAVQAVRDFVKRLEEHGLLA